MAEDYIKDPVVEFDCDGQNPYETLGLKKKVPAKSEEIKKAYRKMSLKYHPDKQSRKTDDEKKEAEAQFKIVNNAYDILMKHQDIFRKECSQQEQEQEQEQWQQQQQEQQQWREQQQQQQQEQQQWREQQQQQWQQQQQQQQQEQEQGQSEQERGRSRYRGQEQYDPLFAEENAEEQREVEEAENPYYQFKKWVRSHMYIMRVVNKEIDDVYSEYNILSMDLNIKNLEEQDFKLIMNIWMSNVSNLEHIDNTLYESPKLMKLYEIYNIWQTKQHIPKDNERRERSPDPRITLLKLEGLEKYLKEQNCSFFEKVGNKIICMVKNVGMMGGRKSIKRKRTKRVRKTKGKTKKKGKKRNSKKYGKK